MNKLYFIYAEYRPVFQHTIDCVSMVIGTITPVTDPEFMDEMIGHVAQINDWEDEYVAIVSLSPLS